MIRCQRCGEPVLAETRYACISYQGCWHAACVLLLPDCDLKTELENRLAADIELREER
jgi:hypothetical protein